MVEVYPRLFLGSETDYEMTVKHEEGWWVVHACKEPYHRQLLGYKGRSAPKDHAEYLVARRSTRLYLNLVDAPSPEYIPREIIDAAIAFIDEALVQGSRVLIHCNQGESRSPSIGLLYLASHTEVLSKTSLLDAEVCFQQLYPKYSPKMGMRGFLQENWSGYVHPEAQN